MAGENPPESMEFHYLKSGGFRVVHADGVWGGPTPRGYITMSFFSERAPIPRRISYKLNPSDGIPQALTLGKELARDGKEGFVREVEVEVMIDLPMAKSLIRWLADKVRVLEDRNRETKQEK